MKRYSIVVVLASLISVCTNAQKSGMQQIERFIQSQYLTVNSSKDLDTLATIILNKYPDSLSRVKAAYVWVTGNITYTESSNGTAHYASAIDSVLKYKTTICSGYVNVFCSLCQKLGISCKPVSGYGRTGTQSITGEHFFVNHEWAAVWLNSQWNLTDVTWGSGYTLEGTSTFVKYINNWYFFTQPAQFVLDHYPQKSNWQLLTDTINWQTFTDYPGVCLGAKENAISNCVPAQSVIRTEKGKNIQFSFTSKEPLNSISISSKQKNIQQFGKLERRNDTYYYTYQVPYTGRYDLLIDLQNIDYSKPGTYSSFVDFVYSIDAGDKENKINK